MWISDYNGILTDLKYKLAGHLTSMRDADVWISWQDAQGSWADIFKAAKRLGVNKPLYVVQHGKSASLDYAPPNSFPLLADKFLCWGKSDYDRMVALGYGNRVGIVGCPLNINIAPKVEHKEKIVLFVPVNTGKEEPENIAVYYELLSMKYKKAQFKILNAKDILKDKWSLKDKSISFNQLSEDFDVVAKLLPWHDKNLYHGNVLTGFQDNPKNNETVFQLLRNVDMVIGLDEGCTEVYAYGHDVPVIIVEGFKYRQHRPDGRKFAVEDIYRTKAATHVSLENLSSAIEFGIAHPEYLRQERKDVAELELGISYGNATDNVLKYIKNDIKNVLKDIKTYV